MMVEQNAKMDILIHRKEVIMTLFEKIKNMTIEEMARERIQNKSKLCYRSNADDYDYYDYWIETTDGKHFTFIEDAVKHEIELLSQ